MPAKTRADPPLPKGTVTFLFTDIEGSTKLWEAHPETMRVALVRHDTLLRNTIVRANGYVFKTVGDAFCAAFAMAPDAVAAALSAQVALDTEPWPAETPIKVRMALYTGAVESRDRDYFGPPINRVARLLSTGYGGQTLLSQTTCELSRDALPQAASLRDLGAHRLKDLGRPEQVYELRHPRLRGDFPPIKSLSTHPNNLPQQLTSFVGREREISEIEALLVTNRLLTLTGAGGSGKTRLGLQVAAESLVQFPDGAWFVELAQIADAGLVPKTVATVLGVAEVAGKPITQTLIEHLKDKRLLVQLDNCEHLLDACADLAETLARQCPHLRILASSLEALGVAGEQTYRVPSLSLPDRNHRQTAETLSACESARLFINRALLVRTGFHVTDQNAPALASICCHLDGIPLAIELAAARVRTLSVEEIEGKLDQRFRLLTEGSRTALPRHQTLRALIDWSYELLNAPEQRLLQRLSVFAGGWTLDAAEQISADEVELGNDVLSLLTSLSNKNLIVSDQTDGRSRYRLLETVRQYARAKLLESSGDKQVRERHRDYYVALAEDAELKLTGAEQVQWLQRLEEEHDNFRSALEWSLVEAGSGGGLRLCGALQRFWGTRGHLSEGRDWCARVLGKAEAAGGTRERAKALHTAGYLAYFQGNYPASRTLIEESLVIRRQLGDRTGVAASLNTLGNVAIEQGDYDAARTRHEESLAIARELGDQGGIANSLLNLGVVADKQNDYPAARVLYDGCLAIRRRLGDQRGIAISLNNLGNVAFAQGDYPSSRKLHEEGLAIRRELRDRRGVALSLGNLADLAFAQGAFADARALGAESLVIARELGDMRQIAYLLDGLAAVDSVLGRLFRAARVWGAAERLREDIGLLSGFGRSDYDQRVDSARVAVGDDTAFDRAWQQGRALTLEQAIDLALDETVTRP